MALLKNGSALKSSWSISPPNELRVDPSQYAVLLTEVIFTPRGHQEKLVEIFFETFKVKGICIHTATALARMRTAEPPA